MRSSTRCSAPIRVGSRLSASGGVAGRCSRCTMHPRRVYLAVAACALVVYAGALWNTFAFDDVYIVVLNPFVREPGAWWRAFAEPYWAGNLTGTLYRPLTVASFALDWLVDGPVWFHAVNMLWHAGASVAVAVLARRWAGWQAGLAAGVHGDRSEEHTSELQSLAYLVCRLLL